MQYALHSQGQKTRVSLLANAVNMSGCFPQLSLLERLPSSVDKLLNVDRKVNVITDSVPAQLLVLPHQVVGHVAQQQHAPFMEPPLGHLGTESLVASFCITAQQSQRLMTCTAASCLE